ncbi:uncharacterized protein LOC133288513 [Gastrolobium bilobum]|uniref:uncharacterized protein LOC133288513 n=1 Tax=Gastrolobium bilobum TaxID=150636 RepID=UPI002AB12526|nr:uncharacterized protein LOC133288513 [Gastrolobium bilobum]
MADCEAPSFSLGLDLAHETPPHSPINPPNHDDDDLGPQVSDSDPETRPDPPRRILKRLRRGPPQSLPKQVEPPSRLDGDDDIEDFSSQDDDIVQGRAHPSAWNHSVCSSSKVSLNGCGVLTPHSSGNCRERKRKQASDTSASDSANLETGPRGLVFPKLKTSPLRRFQLLDSDSDDPVGEDVSGANKVDPPSKEAMHTLSKPVTSFEQNRKTSFTMNQNQDLWKDFSPVKSFSIPTPAFNEVCEEYFRSPKYKGVEESGIDASKSHDERYLGVNSSCQRDQQLWESTDPLPPAHRYFFHEDPRIQKLVRSRLCNFSPLGVNRVNQQPNVSNIDYMGQFNSGGASKTQGVQKSYVSSSTRGKNKGKNLVFEDTFNASGGWVDPKINSPFSHGESCRQKGTKRNSTKTGMSKRTNKTNKSNSSNVSCASENWVEPKSMPKDAGKRRVQASGQSAGHWYTSSEGRKVYVDKNGQELTGRSAYRQYRKESGAGFKKSKKKTSVKKTNSKKRN